jgi:hypothetical protein
MSKAARLELIRRIREDGPQAYLDSRRPVYLIAGQLPPVGETVKVWWKSGNGTAESGSGTVGSFETRAMFLRLESS